VFQDNSSRCHRLHSGTFGYEQSTSAGTSQKNCLGITLASRCFSPVLSKVHHSVWKSGGDITYVCTAFVDETVRARKYFVAKPTICYHGRLKKAPPAKRYHSQAVDFAASQPRLSCNGIAQIALTTYAEPTLNSSSTTLYTLVRRPPLSNPESCRNWLDDNPVHSRRWS
jgi:hypothetical protein